MSRAVYKSGPYEEETGAFGATETKVMYRVCNNTTDHNSFIMKRPDGSMVTIFSGSDDLVHALCACNQEVRGEEANEVLEHWNKHMFPEPVVALMEDVSYEQVGNYHGCPSGHRFFVADEALSLDRLWHCPRCGIEVELETAEQYKART